MAERDDTQSKSRIQPPILPLMANANRLTVVRDQAKPRKLGRYELEECLGIDGGIETYRARVRGLAGFDRIFAVKCLRRGRGGPINLTDPFIKTAKRTASINDARVARVLDADVIDGVAIAVTEFVHGLDLDRFREWAQVSGVLATGADESADKWQKIVAYVGAEVAGGLAAIHALSPPMVHGGLCPRNIVATARGGIKVLDVGLRESAQNSDEPVSPRALVYAGADASSAGASPACDMRALGVVLFELATGELPPLGAESLAARKILDALWPSMADFVAGLLADDPTLRPSAAEAAKILGDFWSEIPDASMVAEMALMVRNFSGFVAESNPAHTPHPLPIEPAQEEAASAIRPPVPSVPPPVSHAPSASGSFLAAGDGPTRAMPSGSYASAMFQFLPTDASIPSFVDETLVTDAPPDGMAFIEPEADHAMAQPQTLAESPGGQTAVDPVPIPELAKWGAQALAALGEQAGVAILPLAPAPELTSAGSAPDETASVPVSDPVIEDAFAVLPPPLPAEIDPAPRRNTLVVGVALPSKDESLVRTSHRPLEDDLIDELHEPDAISADAFEEAVASLAAPLETSSADPGGARPGVEAGENVALEVTAFVAEDEASAAEWASPRLAHAMVAPEADQIRGPTTRTARRSASDPVMHEPEDNGRKGSPSRTRRIAVVIAVVAGLGGAVAAAVLTVAPAGKKKQRPTLTDLRSRPAKAVAPPVTFVAPPVTSVATPAPFVAPPVTSVATPTAAAAVVVTVSPSAAVAPTPATGKKATSTSAVSFPIGSKPDGATVWIDGEERGRTPCTVKLKPGSARLVLVRTGHRTSQLAIEVSEGANIDATLTPVAPPMAGEARFRAECKTEGKFPVVVDGKETGILCPYSKMRVEPGTHTIGVLVPSTGKVHEKEITLSAGVRSINFGD
jgi:serine/threonine protein kinase